ncbi:MAG: DUF6152 family protein [Steroidobacteraceae bacterium]
MIALQKLAGMAALFLASPCWAHHSFAMFDMTKTVTLHGTVKQLQWTSPHCFVQVLVPTPNGTVEWSLEMNSPLIMYRKGWRPGSLRAGDAVTAVIAPTRDGAHGGVVLSVTDPAGQILTNIKRPGV